MGRSHLLQSLPPLGAHDGDGPSNRDHADLDRFAQGHITYMSSVEREMFFIKRLREVPGKAVVGVFGMLHLVRFQASPLLLPHYSPLHLLAFLGQPGIINMWDEYENVPYHSWLTTADEGKDVTRYFMQHIVHLPIHDELMEILLRQLAIKYAPAVDEYWRRHTVALNQVPLL